MSLQYPLDEHPLLIYLCAHRVNRFDVRPFEGFGLGSHKQTQDVIKRLKLDMSSQWPKIPLVV